MRKHTLSVILITKNEADRVEGCLKSVAQVADEIIVLDSGSTDDTVEICRRYTDNVTITDWPGFGKQKQRALDKASCDWVLSIDTVEALDSNTHKTLVSLLDQETIRSRRYVEAFATLETRFNFIDRLIYQPNLFVRLSCRFGSLQDNRRGSPDDNI